MSFNSHHILFIECLNIRYRSKDIWKNIVEGVDFYSHHRGNLTKLCWLNRVQTVLTTATLDKRPVLFLLEEFFLYTCPGMIGHFCNAASDQSYIDPP